MDRFSAAAQVAAFFLRGLYPSYNVAIVAGDAADTTPSVAEYAAAYDARDDAWVLGLRFELDYGWKRQGSRLTTADDGDVPHHVLTWIQDCTDPLIE